MSTPSVYTEEEARALDLWPLDEHNQRLLEQVRPRDWQDPSPMTGPYDLVVIGAGAGGLVSAKQAARRGAKVAFISEHLAGGDCLNVGCVPSKALLRCARAIRDARRAAEFGAVLGGGGEVGVDFPRIMGRMRRLRAKIAPADSHEGTAASGAQVFQGRGRFVDAQTVSVNGALLPFHKAIIATGGRAAVPELPGLASVGYLTNATLFNLTALPASLCVLGGGAVGLEMAQCFATFGSRVTVLLRGPALLHRGDARAGAALTAALERDGVQFVCNAQVSAVSQEGGASAAIRVSYGPLGASTSVEYEQLLVATGRVPNIDDLGLDEAGVTSEAGGVTIDELLCTSNPCVFAVGDCVSSVPRLTHMAGEMAKIAVQNALFADSWAFSAATVPQCTYTEPEHASVGLDEVSAAAAGTAVDVYESGLQHNDRVVLEGDDEDDAFVKILTARGTDRIVGCTIVAGRAGDIVAEVTLAMQAKVGLGAVARVIACYPTQGEGVMQAGLGFIRKHWQKM